MEWIKCSDRLPEPGSKVICYYFPKAPVMEGRIVGILTRHDRLEISVASGLLRHMDENGFALAAQVTHWMPLPNPPQQ